MSLDVTVGGKEAESFVTVEEADQLICQLPDEGAEWNTALSTSAKEMRLRMAAQAMSFLTWRGRKLDREQALCFPRTVADEIPDCVKRAQVFFAYSVIHRALEQRPETTLEDDEHKDIRQLTIKSLSMTFSGVEAREETRVGSSLRTLLRDARFPGVLEVRRYLAQFRGWVIGDEIKHLIETVD